MATDNDDREDENASSEDANVCIEKFVLSRLLNVTEEVIDFEDHGDFVVVSAEDLNRLRKLADELSQEFARYRDGDD